MIAVQILKMRERKRKMRKNRSLTITVIANMSANYGESLGNVSTVQKISREGKNFAIRTKESLKNAIMRESSMIDDIQVVSNGATQKMVSEELNVSNCRALEGGYMNTKVGKDGLTYVRKSSFYLTDAVSTEAFVIDSRFHNNLYLASTYAKQNNLNLQNNAKESGLMPYNYEYDKSLKIYSFTVDLEMVGKDENFNMEAPKEEKADRVIALLEAIENLNLVVKGSLDNSEPIFVVGGLSDRVTHQFENRIRVKSGRLHITKDLKDKINDGYSCGLLEGDNLENELEIIKELSPLSITEFFKNLKNDVKKYYEV